MKKSFINALIKRMIKNRDFMPLRDQEGNLTLNNDINILTKSSYDVLTAVELLDGDRLSREQIEARLQYNVSTLTQMEENGIVNFFEVFIFEGEPDAEKLTAIKSGQYAANKRYLKCLSVDLGNKSVDKLFAGNFADDGLPKLIRELMYQGEYEEVNNLDIESLAMQKEKEYEIQFKAKVPVLTYALIGINILIAALLFLYSTSSGISYDTLLGTFGNKDNFRIMAGEYWRLFTPMFLHAGIIHLALNCYSLYAIGCIVERIYGRYKFIVIYLVAGILGNVASFMLSVNYSVGASGAIFGLLGTLLYFGLERPALFKRLFGYNVIITIIINLGYGFSAKGIDNFAHIGGLIGGFLISGALSEAKDKRWYLNRYLYLVVTVLVACGGLLYGFNNQLNKYFVSNVNIADQLMKEEKWDSVKKLGDEMLAKNPKGYVRGLLLWDICWAENGTKEYEDAIKHAKELLTIDEIEPSNGHYILGVVYYNMGQYDLSRPECLETKKLNPGNTHVDELLNNMDKQNSYSK